MKRPQYGWFAILCVLGLDYFSTLAYQPTITFRVAGRAGPLATIAVVLVTLLGALPIYCYLAGRSPHGMGAFGLIERLVRGWRGKTLILILLGFAATDFVMLKSISLADATVHLLGNNDTAWQAALTHAATWMRDQLGEWVSPRIAGFVNQQLIVTLILGVISTFFWFLLRKGFTRNIVILAVPLVVAYVVMNAMILVGGLLHIRAHPEVFEQWWLLIQRDQRAQFFFSDPTFRLIAGIGWLSILTLPQLALGLSGFEMSMILMPQVKGSETDLPENPRKRIRTTRLVLVSAAIIMSTLLLASSFVTTLLISSLRHVGSDYRTISYLAHGDTIITGDTPVLPFCGPVFGSIYDIVTILILCLAGASVMTALAALLPQFMLRFGMEMRWSHKWGILFILFGLVNFAVTTYFRASIEAQRGAYTVSVLILITTAALVCAADRHGGRIGWFTVLSAGFLVITAFAAWGSPNGLLISAGFILAILALSVVSRAVRVDELRTVGFDFKDNQSKLLWDSLRLADFPILVPHRPGRHERQLKEEQIRYDHQLAPDADIVFLEVEVDDPSNFFQNLLVEVGHQDHRFVIKLERCASVAHAVAAVALEMSRNSKPPGLHFGWSELDLLTASWSYFAFGEGNVPWKVRELILRAEADPARRPRVIIG